MTQPLLFKCIIIGDSGVGKSSFIVRFVEDTFSSEYAITIGLEFSSKMMQVGKQPIKLQIWDTAGTENFRSVTRSFYRNAHAVVLMYNVTARDSFNNAAGWLDELRANAPSDVIVYLVGNQTDLIEEGFQRDVLYEEGKQFSDTKFCGGFSEASAKNGDNVEQIFQEVADMLHEQWEEGSMSQAIPKHNVLEEETKPSKKKCC